MASTITVRPLATEAEYAAYFDLAAPTFLPSIPRDVAALDWQRFLKEQPNFRPESVRGAFQDDMCVGGYFIDERRLCIGSARVRTGCIGAVVSHPDHRHQGIGRALLWDATSHARARGLALMLLAGLTHFYDQFGFIDIFDATEHTIARADVSALPASPYHVRTTTPDDAPALLALYRRHYGPYTGSFARTQEEQAFFVRFTQTVDRAHYTLRGVLAYDAPLLAVDERGEPRGYLALQWGPHRDFGCEAAADNWPAALALLQRQVTLLDSLPGATDTFSWTLPPDSPALYAIADHLPVRSVMSQCPHGGWMACAVDVPALARAMVPAWRERWQRCCNLWQGVLELAVEDDVLALDVSPGDIKLVECSPAKARRIALSRSVFVRLLFGYRPVAWAAGQPDQEIPDDLVPILDALFPLGRVWIAPTDGC